MNDTPRLIEYAFPLKQASLDSVHEKNVRHGHISTLHIWPARRPLAACRAALLATLLPDPGTPEGRQALCEKIGGKVVKKIEKKKMPGGATVEREKEQTEGGVLHWGRETENAETLEWFRQEIKKAYGGRAPKVLDPFAGGGAIPLEAMRLGCEATAIDINPVAWFILKCTLEYPQKLAGQKRPLPEFIVKDRAFMEAFFKAKGLGKRKGGAGGAGGAGVPARSKKKKAGTEASPTSPSFWPDQSADIPDAGLAWHVRAWGQWVLAHARRELAKFYPVYADFEPLKPAAKSYKRQPMRLVPLRDDGTPDLAALNGDFSADYLADPHNPRWVAKPTVAYLWARTVTCKNCRATVPLLKTRWLCKKDKKRVLLTMEVKQAQRPDPPEGASWVGPASVPAPSMAEPKFYSYRRRLPHWRLDGSTYFVTWRLHKTQPELRPEERDLVQNTLNHFDRQRYDLLAHVVMNDHVHVIVRPLPSFELSSITHSWKSFSANHLQRRFDRKGAVWQDESWDRIVRDEEEYWEKVEYVLKNPQKRWPDIQEYRWVGYREAGTEAGPTSPSAGSTNPSTHPVAPASVPVSPQVVFDIEADVPVNGSNAAQRREHDKRLGAGTMSRAGAKCPCCGTIMTMEDIRVRGKAKELSEVMTAVVVDGSDGKEYRLPADHERAMAVDAAKHIDRVFAEVPFGVPDEPIAGGDALGMRVPLYGFTKWRDLFTPRQLLALGTFVRETRKARGAMAEVGYAAEWAEALCMFMTVAIDRTANYLSTICIWDNAAGEVKQTFLRFALPITWDYAEGNPLSEVDRYFSGGVSCVVRVLHALLPAALGTPAPSILKESAIVRKNDRFDVIVTDPPYYDAIPYSDLMDFFYIWLRRTGTGVFDKFDDAFAERLGPKWDHLTGDGELIDDESRHGGDAAVSMKTYEDGMSSAFAACSSSLSVVGRLVIVFANKQPDAWETLVSALIRAGFIVDGSWPIVTEMRGGVRNFNRASLASSVWLVCKKRPASARPGWDNKVLEEMRINIGRRLREFWDAGIRGPDFVWAATGPALEAYSKHPLVKMADEAGKIMSVSDFLSHARRMVVDFVVGRVLSGDDADAAAAMDRLDEPTAYYLLHRHDFGMDDAPAGACILYATACGLSDDALIRDWDLLVKTGRDAGPTEEDEDGKEEEDGGTDGGTGVPAGEEEESGSGSKVKLKAWNHRRSRSLGVEAPGGRPVPLIDRIHHLMQLWKGGDVHKVDAYLDENSLRRHELFRRVLQSLIELSRVGGDERSLMESLSNHVGAKGARKKDVQRTMYEDAEDDESA